jgi:hypothetical protein
MFSQQEHEALMRLMTHATGYAPDSRRIAHWLQAWEHADNPRTISLRVPSLAPSHAADVATVANAARRDRTRSTTLGRDEYGYAMQNIARAYPLPVMETDSRKQ